MEFKAGHIVKWVDQSSSLFVYVKLIKQNDLSDAFWHAEILEQDHEGFYTCGYKIGEQLERLHVSNVEYLTPVEMAKLRIKNEIQ